MHELSLMTGVVDAATEAAKAAGAIRLLGVTLSIGQLHETVDEALDFAFEALCEPDDFTRGAILTVKKIPVRSTCLECGKSFTHDRYHIACPACDSLATELVEGRELQIDSIEVDIPEDTDEPINSLGSTECEHSEESLALSDDYPAESSPEEEPQNSASHLFTGKLSGLAPSEN